MKLLDPYRCLECFIDSRKQLGLNETLARSFLSKYRRRTELFFESYAVLAKTRDPFMEYKRELNKTALTILPRYIETLQDPVKGLMVLALANTVDIWLPWHQFQINHLRTSLSGRVVLRKDKQIIYDLLSAANAIAILLDNAGEAVLDIAYAIFLAQKDVEVYLVAKTHYYETDVVEAEAEKLVNLVAAILGMNTSDVSVKVVGTKSRYPAFVTGKVSSIVSNLLKRVDVVVSKGVANYEALVEYCSVEPEKTIIALRAKCPVLAKALGVSIGDAVIDVGYDCQR